MFWQTPLASARTRRRLLIRRHVMNKKIKEILNLNLNNDFVEKYTLLKSFIKCLSDSGKLILFKHTLQKNNNIQHSLVEVIAKDMALGFNKYHNEVVNLLLNRFPSLNVAERQTYGYVLNTFYDYSPNNVKLKIDKLFIDSKYKNIRKRFYRHLDKYNSKEHNKLLINLWNKYNDTQCAWLIVKRCSPSYLYKMRKKLIEALPEYWQIAKIYVRLIPSYPNTAKELLEIDAITYCYVMAKLKRTISSELAKAIVKNNIAEERFGLLLWCLGEMKKWDTLTFIYESIDSIKKAQEKRILEKFNSGQ